MNITMSWPINREPTPFTLLYPNSVLLEVIRRPVHRLILKIRKVIELVRKVSVPMTGPITYHYLLLTPHEIAENELYSECILVG